MNINEAIEKIENESWEYWDSSESVIETETAIDTLKQIDTQPKAVVPGFIDSFIRYAKAEDMSLFIAMDNAQNKESEWIIKNEETFARAWLDSYIVEKEQLYVVTDGNKLYLKEFDELNAVIIIDDVVGATDYARRYSDKTEAQKAADELGWIVKEVE